MTENKKNSMRITNSNFKETRKRLFKINDDPLVYNIKDN